MTSIPTVSLSVLLASAAAAVIAVTMRPTPPVVPADTNADLQAELLALRQSQAALQQELAQLRTAPAAVAAGPQRIAAGPSDEQIAAAVEAYLQRRTAASGVVEAASAAPFDLDSDFASLQGANFWDDSSLWKRAFAAGRMDDVIARFESLAKANRHDVQAQMDLARAYMAYQQMDPSKWQLSVKADQVFEGGPAGAAAPGPDLPLPRQSARADRPQAGRRDLGPGPAAPPERPGVVRQGGQVAALVRSACGPCGALRASPPAAPTVPCRPACLWLGRPVCRACCRA